MIRGILIFLVLCRSAELYAKQKQTHLKNDKEGVYRFFENNPTYSSKSNYSPPKSNLLIDLDNYKILYATNPYKKIYPASLTKLMTLYVLFSEMDKKNFSLDTKLYVSKNAQNTKPSKLNLRYGETISVENAIKAMIIKSANDVAVVISENIAGSEENFVHIMNLCAKSLKMKNSFFMNSTGLHHPKQRTTPIDIAKLVIALKKNFLHYYKEYFFLYCFEFRDEIIFSRLSKSFFLYDGIDGLKSGYTERAGRNLMVTAKKNDTNLLAITTGNLSIDERDKNIFFLLKQLEKG